MRGAWVAMVIMFVLELVIAGGVACPRRFAMFTIMGTTIEATGGLAMTFITTTADPSKARWRGR